MHAINYQIFVTMNIIQYLHVIRFEGFFRFLMILATDLPTVFVVSTTILIYSVLVVEYLVLHLSQVVFYKKIMKIYVTNMLRKNNFIV